VEPRSHPVTAEVAGSGQPWRPSRAATARRGRAVDRCRQRAPYAIVAAGLDALLGPPPAAASPRREVGPERDRPDTQSSVEGGTISSETRINDRIRVPEVRLVGPNGEQVGIVRIEDALRLAQEADLDLVEVAPQARPPVCKLMDYGKYKYESAQKARESRRNQVLTVIKEQKLRPKIDSHDYETKKRNVVRFLEHGNKVKVTIMFRGREQSRPELGFRLLQRLADDVAELGVIESSPKQDGRNMIMVLAPHKNAKPRARATTPDGSDAPDAPELPDSD
jgi:translation initiation factor IF-3